MLRYVDPRNKPNLLEIGTGSGRTAIELLKLGFRYSGIEPTTSMRDFATAQFAAVGKENEVTLYEGSLPNIDPDELGKFDAIVMFHVLEHAGSYHEAHKWIENCKELLNDQGILYIISPSFKHYGWIFWDIDRTHQYPTSLNRITSIMQDVGLEVLQYQNINSFFQLGPIGTFCSWIARNLLPVEFIDNILRKLTKQSQLFSGFLVGFVLSNCLIFARKSKVK